MKLTIVGCSGSVPGPTSPSSCYLVQHDGFSLLLDMGSGAFGALQRHIAPQDVDAILLSHLHPDHCLDIAPYDVALAIGPSHRRAMPLPLLAPAGARDRLAAASRANPSAGPNPRELAVFDIRELSPLGDAAAPADLELGPFLLSFARMAHPVPTYAVRVALPGGPSLVYSADTGACEALVELAAGADALLCEASYVTSAPSGPPFHLTGRQAGEHAARAAARRLIVTHVPPWYSVPGAVAEASAVFHGDIVAASSGLAIEI